MPLMPILPILSGLSKPQRRTPGFYLIPFVPTAAAAQVYNGSNRLSRVTRTVSVCLICWRSEVRQGTMIRNIQMLHDDFCDTFLHFKMLQCFHQSKMSTQFSARYHPESQHWRQ